MKLGILSDSHGHADRTARAVEALIQAGAQTLIHLGDFERVEAIDPLAGFDAHVVFGNCDWDINSLSEYARGLGLSVDHPMGELRCDDRVVAFTHGHLQGLMEQAMRGGVDYLLYGHTHTPADDRVGDTRVINPGALFRARRYTVAVLDTAADNLQFIELPRDEA